MVTYSNSAPNFIRRSFDPHIQARIAIANTQNLTHRLPPILTVTPDVTLDKLIESVLAAYKLELDPPFWQIQDDQSACHDYSTKLMDQGFNYTANERNFRAASDIFSLCLAVYPNYYYNYLLALVRFKLSDYAGSLTLIEEALAQIRQRQPLITPLAQLIKNTDFTQNFYSFYISCLLFNHHHERAAAIVDFVLEKQVITAPHILFSLVRQYRVTDNKRLLARLSKVTLETIHDLNDQELRKQLLIQLRQVLL
jgi:hypothetical protein